MLLSPSFLVSKLFLSIQHQQTAKTTDDGVLQKPGIISFDTVTWQETFFCVLLYLADFTIRASFFSFLFYAWKYQCLSFERYFHKNIFMWNRKAQSDKLKHHSIKTSVAGINPSRTAHSLEIQFSTVSRMVEQGLFSSRIACSAVRAWKLTLLYCKSKSHTNPAFNCRTEWNFFIIIIIVIIVVS